MIQQNNFDALIEMSEMRDLQRILIDESPIFINTMDRNGRVLHMNRVMLDMLGYNETEIVGLEYLSHFVPENEWYSNGLPLYMKEGINENHVKTRDNRLYLVEWHCRNIKDKNGNFLFSFGFGIDVTERRKTESALKQAFSEIEMLKNKLESENTDLKRKIKISSFSKIIGESEAIKECVQRISMFAQTDTTVLILGETGTGKELIAEALHNAGSRSSKPIIKVNCPAIPETLFESELFGHVQGAFSGATSNKIGRVDAAEGGTLVLDEIAEIPVSIQVKLLRFLENKEYERVGEAKTRKANIKIIASTNANLEELVKEGKFRADLYYRLRVGIIKLPPLRERKSDIPILIQDFLNYYNSLFQKKVLFPDAEALNFLTEYKWLGNVRELKHVLECACISCPDGHIKMAHLPDYLMLGNQVESNPVVRIKIDKNLLLNVLNKHKWHKKETAEALGIHRSTLYRLIDKFEIKKGNAKHYKSDGPDE